MSYFYYGLRARPFGADPYLARCGCLKGVADATEEQKNDFGANVRHGVFITTEALSEEFIKNHELVDLQALSGESWIKALRVVDYLVKRENYSAYLTPNFYKQIGMNKQDFSNQCANHGFNGEDELFVSREDALLFDKQ